MIIDQLHQRLKQLNPPPPIKMRGWSIVDFDKFLEAHYSMLKGNPGNKRFKPYYDRLVEVYEKFFEKKELD
jgi:hypothetical protein